MLFKYAGIINKDRLCLEWVINLPYNQYYKKKPLDLIVGLLNLKGSESFLLNLINENLIIDGSAYIYNYADSFLKLSIDLDLTEEGFKSFIDIIKIVICSIEKLKNLPIKRKFFEETKKMSEVSFQYHVDDDLTEFVSEVATKLHYYEPEHSLYGDFIMEEFDENLIKYCFGFLNNENLNIYLISDSFESLFKDKDLIECSEIADLKSDLLLLKSKDKLNDENFMQIDEKHTALISKTNEASPSSLYVKIKLEEIYDSKYTLEKIDFEKLDLKNFYFKGYEKIDYPADNNLLPEKFEFAVDIAEIKNENSKLPPNKIFENENYSIHHKIDRAFYQPFVYINGKIYIENLNIKNRHNKLFTTDQVTVYLSLWLTLLDKEIFERNSVANFACYYFDFYDNFNYLILKFSGYNDEDKFWNFIKYIFDFFIELHDVNKIENFKKKILILITETVKCLNNMDYNSAFSQAVERFKELSFHLYCKKEFNILILEELKKNILENNDWNDFYDLVTSYLNSSFIDWLVQGHISENKALEMVNYLSNKLQNNKKFGANQRHQLDANLSHSFENLTSISVPKNIFNKKHCVGMDLIKYDNKTHYYHSFNSIDPKNKNSAIVSYFLLGKLNEKEKCISMLLQTMLSDEFFDDLRTQQCLGYSCSLYMKKYFKIDSFVCLVESSVKPPEYITNKITKFLHENDPEAQMDDSEYMEDFKSFKNSLILDLKKKDFILGNEVDRNFEEISNRELKFDKYKQWIEIIECLTIEEIYKFYQKWFIYEPIRVDIGFVSQHMVEENKNILEQNLNSTYKDIVKPVDESKTNEKNKESKNDEEENDNEEMEENESDASGFSNIELPIRVKIEDDKFKADKETFKFNMI